MKAVCADGANGQNTIVNGEIVPPGSPGRSVLTIYSIAVSLPIGRETIQENFRACLTFQNTS